MAKYRVLEKSFIGNSLVEAGAEIEYEGLPSANLEPLDKAADKAAKAAQVLTPEQELEQLHTAAVTNQVSSDSLV